jgi:hypothetical protein
MGDPVVNFISFRNWKSDKEINYSEHPVNDGTDDDLHVRVILRMSKGCGAFRNLYL